VAHYTAGAIGKRLRRKKQGAGLLKSLGGKKRRRHAQIEGEKGIVTQTEKKKNFEKGHGGHPKIGGLEEEKKK